MNIVDLIHQELSGGLLDKLSSYTGQGEMKTKAAAAAAVPALLSAVGGMASTGPGAEKVAAMIRKFTPEEMASLSSMTTGQTAAMFDESKSALTGLIDGNVLATIVGILQKFTGMDVGAVKKLLAFLTPVIFGTLTKKFGVDGLTGSTVSALFAEQKANITNALPAGMSLSNVPGLPTMGAAANAVPAAASGGGMLLPLLLVLAAGAAGYWYFFMRTQDAPKMQDATKALPEVSQFGNQVKDLVQPLTETLNSVKDVATAEVALPKLKEMGGKFDTLKATLDKIPDAAKGPAKKLLADAIAKLKELADKVLALPGVGEKLKPTVDELMAKLTGIAG
jgi:hypothetical protein